MQRCQHIAIGLVATFALAGAVRAADMTVMLDVSTYSPKMAAMLKRLPPSAQAIMAKMGATPNIVSWHSYYSGTLERVDMDGVETLIFDKSTKNLTVFSPLTKTFWSAPWDPSKVSLSAMMTSLKAMPGVKTILGHVCKHYSITEENGDPDHVMTIDLWAAPDVPQPENGELGRMGIVESIFRKINGLTLLRVVHTNNSAIGGEATQTVAVTSISLAPIPANTFLVPAGYTKTEASKSFMDGLTGGSGPGL